MTLPRIPARMGHSWYRVQESAHHLGGWVMALGPDSLCTEAEHVFVTSTFGTEGRSQVSLQS